MMEVQLPDHFRGDPRSWSILRVLLTMCNCKILKQSLTTRGQGKTSFNSGTCVSSQPWHGKHFSGYTSEPAFSEPWLPWLMGLSVIKTLGYKVLVCSLRCQFKGRTLSHFVRWIKRSNLMDWCCSFPCILYEKSHRKLIAVIPWGL